MTTQTGYEDPSEGEEEGPAPQDREWKLEEVYIGVGDGITIRFLLDGEPIGLLRVPDRDYLLFLRKKFQYREI